MTTPDEASPMRPTGDHDQEVDHGETAAGEVDHDAADSIPQEVDHDLTGVELARQLARRLVNHPTAGVPRRRASRPATPAGPQLSGARPDERDPQPLADAVTELMSARGWTTKLSVHVLLGRWSELVGESNAAHSVPEAYDDGVVTVRADATAWATQLRQLAPQIVARLNDKLGDQTVTRINVLGPHSPSWKKGRRSVQGRGPRDTYG